jgi:hypothetical protein
MNTEEIHVAALMVAPATGRRNCRSIPFTIRIKKPVPGRDFLGHTGSMTKRYDLTAIVNTVSEEDLATLAPDDVVALLEALPRQAVDPRVAAARQKLATCILRNGTRPLTQSATRSHHVH